MVLGKWKILKTLRQGNHSFSCLGDLKANCQMLWNRQHLSCLPVMVFQNLTAWHRQEQTYGKQELGEEAAPCLSYIPCLLRTQLSWKTWKGHISRYAYGNMHSISMSLTSILYNMGGLRIKPLKSSCSSCAPKYWLCLQLHSRACTMFLLKWPTMCKCKLWLQESRDAVFCILCM